MIKEWLEEYKPVNHEAAEQELREIMQEIALAGLQRSGFLKKLHFMEIQPYEYYMDFNDFPKTLIFHWWN